MAGTLRSIYAQQHPGWNGIVIANTGADLPPLGDKISLIHLDLPPRPLPALHSAAFYAAVRADKGERILAGLLALAPAGHVMLLDDDDLISNQLAGFVAAHPTAPGWFFDTGYLYSGDPELCQYSRDFHKFCGSSHIIRADLLRIPPSRAQADPGWISRWLGSHYFIKDDLDRLDTPLARLPFNGAIYRIGHADATSGSSPVRDYVRTSKNPAATMFQPLSPEIEAEFFAGMVH